MKKIATVIKAQDKLPLKIGDEVVVIYEYLYNNTEYTMVQKVADKTRHDILSKNITLKIL